MKEVHVCPILMRTVIWEDGNCVEECNEGGPLFVTLDENRVDSGDEDEIVICY